MPAEKKGTIKKSVLVNRDILKWARESMGFSIDELSQSTKIEVTLLKKWESENSEIIISQLKKIAKAEKRALGFFFLQTPPTNSPIPKDFRTLDSVNIETLSTEVRLAIRKAQRNRKFYAYLLENIGETSSRLPQINFSADPVELAERFRKKLSIGLDEQKGWEGEGFALNRWIDTVENNGIPVFQLPLPKKEIRGFCLREDNLPPVIVLNASDAIRGRIFTLFHEYYHLLLVQADIDSLAESKGEKLAYKLIEMKANEFAGSFLVPDVEFLQNPLVKNYIATKDDLLVTRLVNQYKVSAEVIYRRLLNLGYLSEKEYKTKRAELKKQYEQAELRKKKQFEESGKKFIPDYYRDIVKSSSYNLSQKAFDAAAKGTISTNELITFLNVKLAGLDKVLKKTNQHYAQARTSSPS